MDVKTFNPTDTSSNVLLTGSILFAGVDGGSLTEYALKAAIAAAIWMSFKLAGDFFGEKIKKK